MDELAQTAYWAMNASPYKSLTGTGKNSDKIWSKCPWLMPQRYAAEDADVTLRLVASFEAARVARESRAPDI